MQRFVRSQAVVAFLLLLRRFDAWSLCTLVVRKGCPWVNRAFLLLLPLLALAGAMPMGGRTVVADEALKIATFETDATPPLGSPCAYRLAERILDPLRCRGIVLLGSGRPIVLCAVDWIGIGNEGYDAWRTALAQAAGTTTERVAVHVLHQHDAPFCDFTSERLLAEQGLGGRFMDVAFAQRVIQQAAQAVQQAVQKPRAVAQLGLGQARVEKVASNRRILGPDGKVKYVRFSSCREPAAIAAPEGTIDPYVKMIAFFTGEQPEQPVAVLSYYATHPQSYYRQGDVSADFVGMARDMLDARLPGCLNVHFDGAGGNVAAGKYNDGSKANRPVLARRLGKGLLDAYENLKRVPISAADVEWRVRKVWLPPRDTLDRQTLRKQLTNASLSEDQRRRAARQLAFLQRAEEKPFELSCLRLGTAYVLHMPGELFVEYQLAAQKMRPDGFVAMAAYGDYSPGYIGTEIAYSQGGYETGPNASLTAPRVEHVLMPAMAELLQDDRDGR